jgi:hypothetical protein
LVGKLLGGFETALSDSVIMNGELVKTMNQAAIGYFIVFSEHFP